MTTLSEMQLSGWARGLNTNQRCGVPGSATSLSETNSTKMKTGNKEGDDIEWPLVGTRRPKTGIVLV